MSSVTHLLLPYRVMLQEEPGDKFRLVFDCMAEDADHAVEQAENAYPGCEVLSEFVFDHAGRVYAIHSQNESEQNDGAGYWSNADGWTELSGASLFSFSERHDFNLPFSLGDDARWVLMAGVQLH